MVSSASLLSILLPAVTAYSTSHLVARNDSSTACNNSPSLCDKSYGEITHLGAHDAPFLRDSSTDYSDSGNQYYNATIALSYGVRLLTGQMHVSDSELHLCHTSCSLLDAGTLTSWLTPIKSWLDDNPNDVITILLVNSDDSNATFISDSFTASGIDEYAYNPGTNASAPETWPTLAELIANGTRLMTFVASLDSTASDADVAPYLMDEFTYIFENPYDVTSASNFSCEPERPTAVSGDTSSALSQNLLPFMNHMLYETQILGIEEPDVDYVNVTNAPSGDTGNLGDTATECKSAYGGRQPTFVLVDFFDQGPAIETVDSLNNVTDATGRTDVPGTNSEDSVNQQTSSSGGGRVASEISGSSVVAFMGVVVGALILI